MWPPSTHGWLTALMEPTDSSASSPNFFRGQAIADFCRRIMQIRPRIGRYKEQSRERFLTIDELARLDDALRIAETVGLPYEIDGTKPKAKHAAKPENRRVKLDPFAIVAIRLLILTGARLREILHAQWQHIDTQRGIIFLPDSKTGRKPIYLNAAAIAIINVLPRLN